LPLPDLTAATKCRLSPLGSFSLTNSRAGAECSGYDREPEVKIRAWAGALQMRWS
jgi:hypothetical protein